MEFNCTGCGSCCRYIGLVINNVQALEEPFKTEFLNFPYSFKEDGSCENLTVDNKCLVYENRPNICNIDKIYELYYADKISKQEYYLKNARICNLFIKHFDLSDDFLVNESQYM